MAAQLPETPLVTKPKPSDRAIDGNDGDAFDFEHWLQFHNLQLLRDALQEHDLQSFSTLSTLNLSDCKFTRLMADPRILGNAQLIPRILQAIQSVTSRVLRVSSEERAIVQTLKQYKQNIHALQTEHAEISSRCDDKKKENMRALRKFKDERLHQLSTSRRAIDENFKCVHELLRTIHVRRRQQLDQYEAEIAAIEAAQDTRHSDLDRTVDLYLDDIDAEKQYIQKRINKIAEIAEHCNTQRQRVRNNDTLQVGGYEFVEQCDHDEDRVAQINSVGQDATTQYKQAMSAIKQYQRELDEFLRCSVAPALPAAASAGDGDGDGAKKYYQVSVVLRNAAQNALHKYLTGNSSACASNGAVSMVGPKRKRRKLSVESEHQVHVDDVQQSFNEEESLKFDQLSADLQPKAQHNNAKSAIAINFPLNLNAHAHSRHSHTPHSHPPHYPPLASQYQELKKQYKHSCKEIIDLKNHNKRIEKETQETKQKAKTLIDAAEKNINDRTNENKRLKLEVENLKKEKDELMKKYDALEPFTV